MKLQSNGMYHHKGHTVSGDAGHWHVYPVLIVSGQSYFGNAVTIVKTLREAKDWIDTHAFIYGQQQRKRKKGDRMIQLSPSVRGSVSSF